MTDGRQTMVDDAPPRPATPVWDAPVRLFHWAVVLLIPASYLSITYASGTRVELLTALHKLCGYTMLTLLLFRVLWGFFGSETARFGGFLRGPMAGLRHLRHCLDRRRPDDQVGHNPAGGWMVVILLVTLGVQAVSGLFTFDEVPEGPLGGAVSENVATWLTAMHAANFNVILALVALHVLAVAAYAVIGRRRLLRPMITGRKRLPAGVPAPRMASAGRAVVLLVVAAGVVWGVVR